MDKQTVKANCIIVDTWDEFVAECQKQEVTPTYEHPYYHDKAIDESGFEHDVNLIARAYGKSKPDGSFGTIGLRAPKFEKKGFVSPAPEKIVEREIVSETLTDGYVYQTIKYKGNEHDRDRIERDRKRSRTRRAKRRQSKGRSAEAKKAVLRVVCG